MKKTALVFAVIALLGVAMSGPALAGIIDTTTATQGSPTFGFEPSSANLTTFSMNGGLGSTTLACTPVGNSFTCSSDNFVPRGQTLPGAYTSRADKIVSATPDYGCGTNQGTRPGCGGGGTAGVYMNRVNSDGANTAPCGLVGTVCTDGVTSSFTTPVGVDGVLIGGLTSTINLPQSDANPGDVAMPSGTIMFTMDGNKQVSYDSDISQTMPGLYTFNNHDFTSGGTWTALSTRDVSQAFVAANFANSPVNRPLYSRLTLVQGVMGMDPDTNPTDELSLGYQFPGNGDDPNAGVFFSPGLNVRDWVGNGAQASTGTAPASREGDGAGFR